MGYYSSLNLLPSFCIFFWGLGLWAVPVKVTMFLTVSAFKGEVFIVYFLIEGPRSNRKLHNLWEPGFEIYFNTNPCTGVVCFGICFDYETSYAIFDLLQRFIPLTMSRTVWQPYPNWDFLRRVNTGIEIWGPSVQILPLGSHEIRPISEDEIFVFFVN